MDTSIILASLRAQRDRINQAVTALEALDGTAISSQSAETTAKSSAPAPQPTAKKRVINPEGRKRMAEAQQKRWAAKKKSVKPQASTKQVTPKQTATKSAKGGITPAGRKRISEAAKARWAEKKAAT